MDVVHAGWPSGAFLRMVMVTFSVARCLVVDGACAEDVETAAAIMAGSRFSVGILQLVLLGPCDQAIEIWGVELQKYVDDIAIAVSGSWDEISATFLQVLLWLVRAFAELGLDVSLNEGVVQWKTLALPTPQGCERCWLESWGPWRLDGRVGKKHRH